jgi:hypothetical protein
MENSKYVSEVTNIKPSNITKAEYFIWINLAWFIPVLTYGFLKNFDQWICSNYMLFCVSACLTISLFISLMRFESKDKNLNFIQKFFTKIVFGLMLCLSAFLIETAIVTPLLFLPKAQSDSSFINFVLKESNCKSSGFLVVKPWLLKLEWDRLESSIKELNYKTAQQDSILKSSDCWKKAPHYYLRSPGFLDPILDTENIVLDEFKYHLRLSELIFDTAIINSNKKMPVQAYFDFYAVNPNAPYNHDCLVTNNVFSDSIIKNNDTFKIRYKLCNLAYSMQISFSKKHLQSITIISNESQEPRFTYNLKNNADTLTFENQ